MGKTICLVLVAALFFSFPSPFSIPAAGAKGSWAQTASPAPGKAPKPKITLRGGPGDTPETAIVISGAPNSRIGIDAEYYYLMKKFGRPNVDWKLKRQSVLHLKSKDYDKMEIRLKDGREKTIFFDITEFYGKM